MDVFGCKSMELDIDIWNDIVGHVVIVWQSRRGNRVQDLWARVWPTTSRKMFD
ncbi:hypothetical protein LTR49_022831, partial [Elasticomyces elasticus]